MSLERFWVSPHSIFPPSDQAIRLSSSSDGLTPVDSFLFLFDVWHVGRDLLYIWDLSVLTRVHPPFQHFPFVELVQVPRFCSPPFSDLVQVRRFEFFRFNLLVEIRAHLILFDLFLIGLGFFDFSPFSLWFWPLELFDFIQPSDWRINIEGSFSFGSVLIGLASESGELLSKSWPSVCIQWNFSIWIDLIFFGYTSAWSAIHVMIHLDGSWILNLRPRFV